MVSAFGLNDLTSVRVFVGLHCTRTLRTLNGANTNPTSRLGVENSNDVSDRLAVLGEQCLQVRLKLDFFLEASIILE